MNKKIAFITCVNNEEEFAESVYYINRIYVPEGYEIDVIAVREAPSMTAGYNAAMKSSDAKYKIYLHQDTFIINRNFILDIIEIFQEDSKIGMLGCVGCDNLPLDEKPVVSWNTGMVYHNCTPSKFIGKNEIAGKFRKVDVCDGLLLATQYDVEWREDLFDGWDFYDISQCFEIKRAGYDVVTVYQENPWCYHDNAYSKFKKYDEYYKKFTVEYQDMKAFYIKERSEITAEYEVLKEAVRNDLRYLVDCGHKEALQGIFEKDENKGYLHLREFEIMAAIDKMEQAAGLERFWKCGETYEELTGKIRNLKHALKRLEYSADVDSENLEYVISNYSIYAIDVVYHFYKVEKARVLEKILEKLMESER